MLSNDWATRTLKEDWQKNALRQWGVRIFGTPVLLVILILMTSCGTGASKNNSKIFESLDFCILYEPIHDITSPTVRRNNFSFICECTGDLEDEETKRIQELCP